MVGGPYDEEDAYVSRLCALVGGIVVIAGVLAGSSSAAHLSESRSATTDPGKALLVFVNISDQGIKLSSFLRGQLAGNNNLFVAQPARGQYALFQVRNIGKKFHNFQVLGKKTRKLAPGAVEKFHVYLAARGRFPYDSTLDKHNAHFRGIFKVL